MSTKVKVILRKIGFKYVFTGLCKTRWFDITMVERIVKAFEFDGNALMKFCDRMEYHVYWLWYYSIEAVLGDHGTIHLVYLRVQELLCHLEDNMNNNYLEDILSNAGNRSKEILKFKLNSDASDFIWFFIVATFFDPFYKGSMDDNMATKDRNEIKQLIEEETQRGKSKW